MATVERGNLFKKWSRASGHVRFPAHGGRPWERATSAGKLCCVWAASCPSSLSIFPFFRWYRTWNNARLAVARDTRRTYDISLLLGGSFSSSSKSEGHAATVISRPLCQPVDKTIAPKRLHNGSPEWCTPLVYVSGLLTRPTKLCDCDSCVREAPEWESCEGRAVASLQLVSPPSLCLLCG